MLTAVLDFLNDIVWSQSLLYLLLGAGLFFTIRSRVVQVRLIGPMVKYMFKGQKSDEGISSFQALCTALAGRVGTGNIVGTSAAIIFGGPGALFWMWLLAFLGASSAFIESTLSQVYKIRVDGQYRGGPAYYIERGMGQKGYAIAFGVVTIIAMGFLSIGIQSNSITSGFFNIGAPKWIVGLITAIVLGLIIFGGIQRIARIAELIVPIMAVVYVAIAIVMIIVNASQLGNVIGMIFSSAFGAHSIFGGILGSAILWGVKRGIYSNEAGQGTQPHASAAAEVSHPVKQGLVQAFGVYIDTLFVCTATGFMVIMTDCYNVIDPDGNFLHLGTGMAGMENMTEAGAQYAQGAVATLLGGAGPIFVAICLGLFAFTTIMNYYYQAESNIVYIFSEKEVIRKRLLFLLKVLCMAVVFGASLISATQAWDFGDIGVGMMAWLNIIAIILMQKTAWKCLKDFEIQRKAGLDPVFEPDKLGIENADLWNDIVDEKYRELREAKRAKNL